MRSGGLGRLGDFGLVSAFVTRLRQPNVFVRSSLQTNHRFSPRLPRTLSLLLLHFRFRQDRAHLKNRNHRQEANEQEQQRKEEPDRADEHGPVPLVG